MKASNITWNRIVSAFLAYAEGHELSGQVRQVRREHSTIGRIFNGYESVMTPKGLGGPVKYLCTYWGPCGFHMSPLNDPKAHVCCVSERAIGRTFHLDWPLSEVQVMSHAIECQCSICINKEY